QQGGGSEDQDMLQAPRQEEPGADLGAEPCPETVERLLAAGMGVAAKEDGERVRQKVVEVLERLKSG
ncbi:MAG: hypothetical protein ACKPKO_29320, partial [Candidatus Fonsibacter sp.]